MHATSRRWGPVLGAVVGLLSLHGPHALGQQPDRGMSVQRAPGGRRLALVIGNGNYVSQDPLPKALNDAETMRDLLRELGWEVRLVRNASRGQMSAEAEAMLRGLGASDQVLFFYAGHGAEYGGTHYLLPVEFEASRPEDLTTRGFSATDLVRDLARSHATSVLFLDACRNNPFLDRSMRRGRSGGRSRGPTRFGQIMAPESSNMIVVTASSAGRVAEEDSTRCSSNSPFTCALSRRLRESASLQSLQPRITADVRQDTNRRQSPNFSMGTEVDVWICTQAAQPTVASATPSPTCTGGRLWNAAASRCECPASTPNFNTATQQCVGTCFPGSSWNASRNGCDCEPGLVWNASAQRCNAPMVASAPPPSPAPSLGSVVGNCPSGFVYVSGGTFQMGSSSSEPGSEDSERPVHGVTLSPYCMGRTEVTVGEYRACVDRGGCTAPGTGVSCNWRVNDRENHPVNCINWEQARAYCAWRGQRLPTEAEWEFAASVGGTHRYPWGDAEPTDQVCWNRSDATCAVGSSALDHTPLGISDLSGNVAEWVSDWYGRYASNDQTNPAGPASGDARVGRGRGWSTLRSSWLRARNRGWVVPSDRDGALGVRCVAGAR